MPPNTIHDHLRKNFRQANKELWRQTATREVEGKDPLEILSWEGHDKIKFFPYYDHSDVKHLDYLSNFRHTVGNNDKWINVPRLAVAGNEKELNKISLEHLENGADGLLYVITDKVDPHELLDKVDWPYCSLFFRTAENTFLRETLRDYILQKKFEVSSLNGALFWDSIPKKQDIEFYLLHAEKIKSLGTIVPPGNPVKAIAEALTRAVNCINSLSSDVNVETIIYKIAFSVPVDTHFFESIAKFKALRLLWYQIAQAYQAKEYKLSDLHLHANITAWTHEKFEPHSNMLKATTAAMAAAMGGCDSVTIEEQDEKNATMRRISRNISAVLKDESHFDKVSDPIAGAYGVDAMVHEISQNAWSLFQSKLK